MTVIAHTKQNEIDRVVGCARARFSAKRLLENRDIGGSSLFGWIFAVNAMDVAGNQGHVLEKSVLSHLEIALRIVRRHATFVSKEDVHSRPVDLVQKRLGRQARINRSRRAAAG